MSQSVLNSIALTYQPIWNRERRLAAVRLRVQTVQADAVDAEHLLQLLGHDWPVAAPVLVLSLSDAALLQQALACPPVPNTWIEVPAALFQEPRSLAALTLATRRGHKLLRHAELADVSGTALAPLDALSLLRLRAGDTAAGLGLLPPGQIYEGAASASLARHCLDEAGAWGLLGWPDEDVLQAQRLRPPACDADVIAQVLQAVEDESAVEHLERLLRQDPVLAYRLLVQVNSSAYGSRHSISSLRHALLMIGLTALSRWLHEQLPASQHDPDLYPVRYAMVMHARLAQHLLEPGFDDDLRAEVYTSALFSQLDRLLRQPLADLLEVLPLSARLLDAVLRHSGPYHELLDVARAQGKPDQLPQLSVVCDGHGVSLEHANRALIRMLASSRHHASPRSQRLL